MRLAGGWRCALTVNKQFTHAGGNLIVFWIALPLVRLTLDLYISNLPIA
jgi:hypothetical protein